MGGKVVTTDSTNSGTAALTYRYIFIFCLWCVLSACQPDTDNNPANPRSNGHGQSGKTLLERIRQRKKIIIATRNAPTTYYDIHDEPAGIEYEMTQAYAQHLGVNVEYLVKDSLLEIFAAIQNGDADLAAAGLTRTAARQERFLFGPAYQQVQQQLVCRRGGKHPDSLAELQDVNIVIPAATSYAEQLQQLQKQYSTLQWRVQDDVETEALLEEVWQKKIDCTVADSNIVAINRRYYPELSVRFNITEPEDLAWALHPDAYELQKSLQSWFAKFAQTGKQDALLERYYGYIDLFDYVDTRAFNRRVKKVLPKYQAIFIRAAQQQQLDWRLLAAQAYQESHWRPRAKSPTGVRGIMMLTLTTAKELGVKSRLDPRQSIHGGARYLRQLLKRVPDEISEHDRAWFALAAYNVGMGHMHDARRLAERLGKDPNQWHSLAEVLPLLSQKKYYRTLKYGYARGREPVNYVNRIRDYYDILQQTLPGSK